MLLGHRIGPVCSRIYHPALRASTTVPAAQMNACKPQLKLRCGEKSTIDSSHTADTSQHKSMSLHRRIEATIQASDHSRYSYVNYHII